MRSGGGGISGGRDLFSSCVHAFVGDFWAPRPDYRKEVLPDGIPVVGVEAGVSFGWDQWADRTVTIDQVRKKRPGDQVMQVLGISAFAIETAARDLLPNHHSEMP